MKIVGRGQNIGEDEKSSQGCGGLSISKSSPLYHIFNFLSMEYGGDLEKMLHRINGMMTLGVASSFIKNKKLKRGLQVGQALLSAGLFTTDFAIHVKNYVRQLKKENKSTFNRQMIKACQILDVEEKNPAYGDLPLAQIEMGIEITQWLLSHPKTEKFKILNYYDLSSLKELGDSDEFEQFYVKNIGILIEIGPENKKILWDLDLRYVVNVLSYVKNSVIISEYMTEDFASDFRKAILSEYINSLHIEKNALFFDSYGGITAHPRHKILEKINQFDVDHLIQEIKEVLDKKRRRAFAFVGRQGVGKSAILHKIEEQITEYMIIHLTPDDFGSPRNLKDRFNLIKTFQPAIVMIEDLDSCGLKNKDRLTGEFLNCIDEINRDLNIVILVTINDTSSVHYTVLNRPGRFDRIFEIESPKSVREIYEITTSKISSIKDNYCGKNGVSACILKPGKELNKVMERCLTLKFTQAEITNAIVEQAFIDINISKKKWSEVNNIIFAKFLDIAVNKHLKTKEAIKKCDFNNMNPDEFEKTAVEDYAPISVSVPKKYRSNNKSSSGY